MNPYHLQNIIKKQQIASNPANSSWVFASAGSGKTKILISRLLRLLLSDISPQKILCLTFTKTAAGEMQQRVEQSLSHWASCDDKELTTEIYNLTGFTPNTQDLKKARIIFFEMIDKNDKIKIMTIHSFCQSILKIFPFEAGINPNFEILEESSKKILLKKAIDLIFKKISHNHPLKHDIAKIFQEHSENEVNEAIADLINNKEDFLLLKDQFFDVKNIIKQIYHEFNIADGLNFNDILQNFKKEILNHDLLILQNSLKHSKIIKDKDIIDATQHFLNDDSLDNFITYKSAFFTQKNEPKKPSNNINKNDNLQKIYDQQCQIISNFSNQINSLRICHNSRTILHLTAEILDKYNNLKKRDALLDYEDLIIITNQILQNDDFASWIKMKMDMTYDHILVDESQDTNLKQWHIIKSLSEDFFSGIGSSQNTRSLFVVGDEKQSIYSFQGAESDISSKIYNYYNQQSGNIKKIDLNNSFRSSINILKAVDDIFQNPQYGMAISKTNLYQNHNPIKTSKGHVEIWPQINNQNHKNADFKWQLPFLKNDKEIDAKEKLSRYIASKIKYEVTNKRQLEGKNRAVNFGDYMILLRNKTNNFDKSLIAAFKKSDIPFSSQSRIKFSESLAIQDLLAIAKFITTPFDNLNLATLLKSPIFALNDSDLFTIIHFDKESNIVENLAKITKYQKICDDLNYLKNLSQNYNSFEFYYKILNQEYFKNQYIHYFGIEFNEIIDKFLNILYNFCQNKSSELQKLLEFISKSDPEISLKSLTKDSVKILTIHSAKGLQAPIIFIPDCCFNSNKLKNTKEIISWIDFNNYQLPIWCNKKSWQNDIIKNHNDKIVKKSKEEYLRLLYVAMTRAENEIYIAGFGNDKDPQNWYQIIKNSLPTDNYKEDIYNQIESAEQQAINSDKKPTSTPPQTYEKPITKTKITFQTTKNENQLNFSQIKGTLLHEIIDFNIKNINSSPNWLKEKSKILIDRNISLSLLQKKIINNKIAEFLNSNFFKNIKNKKINSEYEIAYQNKISRLDLVIEDKNIIEIIDYKSDQKIPQNIPKDYKTQLQNYQKIIKKLHPQKEIKCSILWLETMEFSNAI